MGAVAAIIAGVALAAGGTAMSAGAASKKGRALREAEDMWLPDTPGGYASDYFSEMAGYMPRAKELADESADADFSRIMKLREQAMPGIGKGIAGASNALMPLLRGELPPAVMDAYTRAGGASTVGSGFGGSGFGFLNTGLFGARGAMGAMQTGFSLLPALMSSMPQLNSPSTAAFLEAIMTPAQRMQSALQFRGQQLGLRSTASGMQTSGEVWGSGMQQVGGILLGGGMGGMGMGGMAGGMAPGMGGTSGIPGMGPTPGPSGGASWPGMMQY